MYYESLILGLRSFDTLSKCPKVSNWFLNISGFDERPLCSIERFLPK